MLRVDHVAIVRWPEEEHLRAALRNRRAPRLLLVPKGMAPPADLDRLEDWVSASADADEIEVRLATLAARIDHGAPMIDDDDVLRFGDRWIALGPIEARIARVLTAHAGEVVARGELERAAWGNEPVRPNTTDRLMHRLRIHTARVGLSLATVRGKGYVLEIDAVDQ